MNFKLLIIVLIPLLGYGQREHTFQLWTDYYHSHRINGFWTFFNDAGIRGSQLQTNGYWRVHARPSVEYRRQVLHVFRGGIGFFYQNNIGSIQTFEVRPWQGYKLNWPNTKRLRIYNYVRLEQRGVTDVHSEGVSFTLKLRYKIGTLIPIGARNIDVGTFYIPISIEIFGNLAAYNQEIISDRNRYELGLGYRMKEDLRLQIIYTLQSIRNNIEGGILQSDHVLRISVRQSFGID